MRSILRLIAVVGCVLLPAMLFAQGKADDARKHLVRGATAIEMAKSPEDLALAIEEFKKAIEIAPRLSAAWFNLGAVQAKTGKFKEAIDSYNHYLQLSPQAADAGKVRDEIIKLEFKLEQTDKFKALSGQWMSDRGYLAYVTASTGALAIFFPMLTIGAEFDLSYAGRTGDNLQFGNRTLYVNRQIDLQQKGGQFVGPFESGSAKPLMECRTPPQKSTVAASVEMDQIVLRWPWTRFRVVEDFGSFLDTKLYCLEVSPAGTLNVEIVLKKLPPGGIAKNAPGLQTGDQLVSVDGVALESLSPFDREMKVRGQVGATVQLMVKRAAQQAGALSSAKYETVPVTAAMTEIPSDPPAYQARKNYF